MIHVFILQSFPLLVTFNVLEIRKNLDLRKILSTPKIFLKSRFHCTTNTTVQCLSNKKKCDFIKVSFPLNLPCVCLSPIDKINGIVRYILDLYKFLGWRMWHITPYCTSFSTSVTYPLTGLKFEYTWSTHSGMHSKRFAMYVCLQNLENLRVEVNKTIDFVHADRDFKTTHLFRVQ